jgi:hypothetical protein
LRLSATGTGVDREQCRAAIIRTTELKLKLEAFEAILELDSAGRNLAGYRAIVFGDSQFEQIAEVVRLTAEGKPGLGFFAKRGELATYFPRFVRIVPEIGLGRACFELGNLSLLSSDVKDAPVSR